MSNVYPFFNHSPSALRRALSFVGLALLAPACGLAQSAPSNAVLQTLSLNGGQKRIKWTNLSNANAAWWDEKDAYYVWPISENEGEGELLSIAPAFPATAGLYAYRGDFGLTVTNLVTPAFPIKTAVLQLAEMRHPGYRFEDHLRHHHTAHWSEDDAYGGDANDNPSGVYAYNPALAALDDLLPGYDGGPLLTYTTATGGTGTLAATSYNLIGGPTHISTGGFSGNYYSFAWQWDLSAIEGDVTRVFITAPIIHSASTIGAQLDLGGAYTRIVSPYATPPAALSATAADSSVALSWPASPARAEVTGYNVKRATASGGPYTFIGNGSVFTTISAGQAGTTFTDTGLANGQTYYYVVSAVNASGEGENSPEVAATPAASPLAALQSWRQLHFGSPLPSGDAADEADPDGDGLPNLLEYALGGHPLQADAPAHSPALALDPAAEGGPRLALTFTRIADPALLYTVEASTDLAAWDAVWSSTGADNIAGAVTVPDAAPLADFPRRFLRLRVSGTP